MRIRFPKFRAFFFSLGFALIVGAFFFGRSTAPLPELNAAAVRQFVMDLPNAPSIVPGVYRYGVRIDGVVLYKVKVITTVEK